MFAIKFDPSCVTEKVKARIMAEIETLEDVTPEVVSPIYEAAVRSAMAGGDNFMLSHVLQEHAFDKKRAKQIACHLNSVAKSVITKERQLALGITEALWLHSGAPCEIDPKKPTGQDIGHKAANGKQYKVSQGMLIGDEYIYPGERLGCKCVSRSVIPGLSKRERRAKG